MPNPRRVVRKSVAMLAQLGVPRRDAANVVIAICDEAAAVIWRHDPDMEVAWLAAIAHEARLVADASGSTAAAVQEYADHVTDWAARLDACHAPQPVQHYHPDVNPDQAVSVVGAALDALKTRRYRRPGA